MAYKYLEIPIIIQPESNPFFKKKEKDDGHYWDIKALKSYFSDEYPNLVPKKPWSRTKFFFEENSYEFKMSSDMELSVSESDICYEPTNSVYSESELSSKYESRVDKLQAKTEKQTIEISEMITTILKLEARLKTKIDKKLLLDVIAATQGHHKI